MRLRDVLPHDDDIVGAAQDLCILRKWLKSRAARNAPAPVRAAVDSYIADLRTDLTGEAAGVGLPVEPLGQQLRAAATLESWLASAVGKKSPVQVKWAIESFLDAVDATLAETVSHDPDIRHAQAERLARILSQRPLREGLLARNYLAGGTYA